MIGWTYKSSPQDVILGFETSDITLGVILEDLLLIAEAGDVVRCFLQHKPCHFKLGSFYVGRLAIRGTRHFTAGRVYQWSSFQL